MGLEAGTFLDDLVVTNPVGATDPKSQGDDHLRLIKTVLKNSFPDVDQAVSTIISSATEPTLNRKGTLWLDETANVAKLRDKADSAWITLPISITANNTVDIDGGTIDGATIGGSTPAAGTFTDLNATNMDSTPIGATTPATVKGTTVESTGDTTVGGNILVTGTVDGRDVAADGTTLDAIAARVLLETQTASNSASIDFDSGVNFSTYKKYEIELIDVVIATDNAELFVRTSTDGGSTYDSGASDYAWGYYRVLTGTTPLVNGDSADSKINITYDPGSGVGWGNAAGEAFNGEFSLWNPSGTNKTIINFVVSGIRNTGNLMNLTGAGSRQSAANVDGIQFLMSSGNIVSGTFKIYGIV